MRIVLDTSCVVAALRSPAGASATLLRAARKERLTLLVSVPLAIEYEAVCSRAEHRTAAGLDEEEVRIFLDALIAMAEPVEPHYLWRPQLRDAADEMVLEAAANGRADAIVTFNIGDFGSAPRMFGIAVLLPSDALKRMG
ncbi:MAG: putative toxin-antitoxin system toxin component, PIN family [Rhizomicrobium sp.]